MLSFMTLVSWSFQLDSPFFCCLQLRFLAYGVVSEISCVSIFLVFYVAYDCCDDTTAELGIKAQYFF
jgi:hypothetical protein